MISIVIRARNCATDLRGCLGALAGQRLSSGDAMEVIVVDNESTDDTAAVARAAGARVVTLGKDAFSWGRALNTGIAAASGEIVILLSADAHPADPGFLQAITAPFADPLVASCYGRQAPRSDAPIDEIARLSKTFGTERRVFEPGGDMTGLVASNACGAIRRSMWESIPYDELVEGAEEWAWMEETFAAGFHSVYEPAACVYHSHNDPIFRNAVRAAELYISNRRIAGNRANVADLLLWMAANARRRVFHCLVTRTSLGKRLGGVARIPAEAAITIFAYALMRFSAGSRLRATLWDLRFSS